MSTEKDPDYAGIAERMRKDFKQKLEVEKKMYGHASAPIAEGYASCMEARLRSDWETIRLLKAQTYHHDNCGYWTEVVSLDDKRYCGECTCGLSAHLSKLLEPFT